MRVHSYHMCIDLIIFLNYRVIKWLFNYCGSEAATA